MPTVDAAQSRVLSPGSPDRLSETPGSEAWPRHPTSLTRAGDWDQVKSPKCAVNENLHLKGKS